VPVKFISIILVSIFICGYFVEALDGDRWDFRFPQREFILQNTDAHSNNTEQDDTRETAYEGHGQFGFTQSTLPPNSAELYFLVFPQSPIEYFFVPKDRERLVLLRPPIS
jgi:hypothetical protein